MKTENIGNICIIIPEMQQIDVNNANEFGEELLRLLDNGQKHVLDMQNISFMDSSGLGKIISALRKAHESRKSFVLANITDAVQVLFNMVRLTQITDLYTDVDDAVKAIRD